MGVAGINKARLITWALPTCLFASGHRPEGPGFWLVSFYYPHPLCGISHALSVAHASCCSWGSGAWTSHVHHDDLESTPDPQHPDDITRCISSKVHPPWRVHSGGCIDVTPSWMEVGGRSTDRMPDCLQQNIVRNNGTSFSLFPRAGGNAHMMQQSRCTGLWKPGGAHAQTAVCQQCLCHS